MLLALIEIEFSDWDYNYVPKYLCFNNKEYEIFDSILIEDILNNTNINTAYFVCSDDVFDLKTNYVRFITYPGIKSDCYIKSTRDL